MPHATDALTADELAKLRELVERTSLAPAARTLRVGREAVVRVLAGLPVRAGSVSLIRAGLAGAS